MGIFEHINRLTRSNVVVAAVLLLVTFGVYANCFDNEFTNWDDDALVVNNQAIRSLSWDNIKTIFDYRASGTYQPVRVFSYAIDYHFWGLNPLGYHLHSTFLHGLAAIMVFLIVLKIMPVLVPGISNGAKGAADARVRHMALITALFFAVHPVHVEAVAWLSIRSQGL